MPANWTWACFDCRETVRRPAGLKTDVPCPACGRACQSLGYRLRLPPKRKVRSWQKLRVALQKWRIAHSEAKYLRRLAEIRRIRYRIKTLEARGGMNRDRAAEIHDLRNQLATL